MGKRPPIFHWGPYLTPGLTTTIEAGEEKEKSGYSKALGIWGERGGSIKKRGVGKKRESALTILQLRRNAQARDELREVRCRNRL